ncbi:N-acetylmuramoyl-L-alanine amidase [Erwinia sp. HR93]|uniref:N-acetylmuramoyl-L-alanine amidase n=1 Tax=Erwinia sp. HR93 TaxID=3094840 RepID=UPI002ADEC2A0|nr:N-acetylmuramoyl-L-alanine amidase [Erwinia sp. HR93]MEA1064610.1 N-acetylmuramoyl-L-alanine amidase [Erwinia sp. HR93]
MKGIWLLLIVFLAGCATQPGIVDRGTYRVETRQRAPNAFPRERFLVIHYTADEFDGSLAMLTGRDVSVHYLLPERPPVQRNKPLIWALVPENQIAWHAGKSFWRGTSRLNDTSIGIELVNQGYQKVGMGKRYYPFEHAQIAALIPLARDIIQRHRIAPQNVVAHADIAPQRKVDPGPLFPWHQLALAGIGAWPEPARVAFYLSGRDPYAPVNEADVLDLLARYGYETPPDMTQTQRRRVIAAFQMHFRPARYDGVADAQTQAIAEALLEKYGQN